MSRLKEIALELLRKYEISKSLLIDECSCNFEHGEETLSEEVANYIAEIQEQEHEADRP